MPGLGGPTIDLSPHALSTVPRVKIALGNMQDTTWDDWIAQRINGLSRSFERWCGGRHWEFQQPTEYLTGQGRQLLPLRYRPIRSITSVTIGVQADGTGGTLLTVGTDFQIYDANAGLLWKESGWPDGRLLSSKGVLSGRTLDSFARTRSIAVVYTACWITPQYDGRPNVTYNPTGTATDEPEELEEALFTEVQRRLNQLGSVGLKSARLPIGTSVNLYTDSDLLPETEQLLRTYRETLA